MVTALGRDVVALARAPAQSPQRGGDGSGCPTAMLEGGAPREPLPYSKLDKPGRLSLGAQLGRVGVFAVFALVVMLACLNLSSAHEPRQRAKAPLVHTAHKMAGLAQEPAPPSFYSLHAQDITGKDVAMREYSGDVLFITNVATY
jgi:hypothetical protein